MQVLKIWRTQSFALLMCDEFKTVTLIDAITDIKADMKRPFTI